MQHIHTDAKAINNIKKSAKRIKSEQDISHSEALELAAKQAGYDNYHHVNTCASKTKELDSGPSEKVSKEQSSQTTIENTPPQPLLGTLKLLRREMPSTISFSVDDFDNLNKVEDMLGDMLDETGGFEFATTDGFRYIIRTCKKLIKIEPGFIDAYAHWIGALSYLEKDKEAVKIGLPVFEEAYALVIKAPKKYKLSYYELENRPFFRLAKNLVLALHFAKRGDEARDICDRMIKLWPKDNTGFRLLKEPELED